MGAVINGLKFLLPLFALGLLCYGALFLATRRQSPLRNWVLATNSRIVMLGVFALFLVWILFATYTQITSM